MRIIPVILLLTLSLISALSAQTLKHERLTGTVWDCVADGKSLGTVTFTDGALVETSWAGAAAWKPIPNGVEIFGVALAYADHTFTGINSGGKTVTLVHKSGDEAAIAPDAAPATTQFIPDIAAVDVTMNLTNKGFALKKVLSGEENTMWTCEDEDRHGTYVAETYGSSPTKIISVRGTVISRSRDNIDTIGADFLGYLGSLPYEGSQPAKARAWVEANIHRSGTTVIGGVKFEIFANAPAARMLRISMGP